MFESFTNFWNKHGFEIILVVSLVFIAIFALCRIGKKGTWSSSYHYDPSHGQENLQQKRGPRKESSGEKECRRVLQKIFNKPFKTCRPDFLRNPVTGGRFNLELDCYEESMKLAAEYNGVQHYKYTPYFHKNKEAFYNQMYRDQLKRYMCQQNSVNLIEVPNTVEVNQIEGYLTDKLRMIGYIN